MAMTTLPAEAGAVRTHHAMGASRRVRRAAWCVTAIVLVALAWFWLAPPAIGGSTSYAVTTGASMAPQYRAGDVVLLRSAPSYQVGQVAAYRDPRLGGRMVLHEIVAVRGGHYVLRGLGDRAADSYRPTRAQIVGAVWLHIQGAGAALVTLRDPAAAVLLALLLVGTVAVALWRPLRRRFHAGIQRRAAP